MSRRDFVKTGAVLGGGLVLGCHIPFSGLLREAAAAETPLYAPNAFIRIGADDTVTLIINKSEMGQGVYTSLPMLIAEELESDWQKVVVEASPVAAIYNHTTFGSMVTGGSTSVRTEWERLSMAGAAAREMLIAAAARRWQVEPASCRAENGRVVHASGKSLAFGELAAAAARLPVPAEIRLKSPASYRLIGKPRPRLDSPAKIDGSAQFGLDVQLPGMLTAVVARPPVFGGKVVSLKSEKAKAVPGVQQVVQVPSGVAVVATGFWPAQQGREALEIVWDDGAGATLSTEGMREEYAKLARTPGAVARKEGDPETALATAARQLSAEYEVPYLAHATMEPLNCVVDLRDDRCDIWTGTQMQTFDRSAAAVAAGLGPEQIGIHTTFLGGGFGRRANPQSDFVVEAVQVAKAVKKPVKVVWTREDDTRGGYYRPMWYDRIAAGLDGEGKLVAWRHTIVGQSIMAGTPFEGGMVKEGVDETSVEGASDIPYAIPNIFVDLHSPKNVVPVLWWRSVGHSHTAFVVEGFLDEAAHAAGKDPFEFRRALLADKPRHRGVLELAAKKAGWGKALPAGRGRGIAVHESFGSFIAQVAEVSVGPQGQVRVHRVVCAIDCGKIVNPDTIEAQMESGIVFGLSAALHGAITLKNGRVEQGNFDDYPLLRIDEMPQVEVHIVPSEEAPGGVGEPGVPPVAPAVANAVYAASGVRLRSLPMTPEKMLQAMKG
jgi:isoquinoline 1-oxidoreductase beta subunit